MKYITNKDVLDEAKFALNFDYWVRLINLPISIFGILINIYHFWILSKKSLRDTPVFIIMMVICGSDLVQLLALLPNDAKFLIIFNLPKFCTDTDTYFGALLTLIQLFVNGFTIFVSSWMAVLMAFFRSLSIKFAMSSFSEFFSQTSTAYKLASTVISIGFVYNFFSCFLRYSIIRQDRPCDLHLLMSDTEFYFVLGVTNANHESKIISFFDGMFQLLQLILFTFSTVSLARFIRESSRNKIMRSRESRETERTEGLILFTLVPFFVFVFPIMAMNFYTPILSNFDVIP